MHIRSRLATGPLLLAALLLLFFLAAPQARSEEGHAGGQTVVVHLSSYTNDLHAVTMSLKIAALLAAADADVTLFLDLEGVRLADDRAPQNLQWGNTAPVAELYANLIEAGGTVLVCPHCARAAGIGAGNLRQGATLTTDTAIRDLFLAADKVIDY